MAKWNYSYDAGHTTATLLLDNKEFVGEAFLHPDDIENESTRRGQTIAETRVYIKAIQYHIQSELKPSLKALKHLNACIQQSNSYNPKGYESRMLRRNIRLLEQEIQDCKLELSLLKAQLNEYISRRS